MAGTRITEEQLPANYVDQAEHYMRNHARYMTTSKLRNMMSLFSMAYHRERLASCQAPNQHEQKLSAETESELLSARVRMVYEYGRDKKCIGRLMEDTQLLHYLKGIQGDRTAFLNYYHYLEALIAYHKFYGGREN